jgi:cysteine-rich repeat protein
MMGTSLKEMGKQYKYINTYSCNLYCNIEPGWTCAGAKCTETCGDSRNYHSYLNECDDGNTLAGDGCDSSCKFETGYICSGGDATHADVCPGLCGDGKLIGE